MKKQNIVLAALAIFLLLTATAIYFLIQLLQLNFMMAFLTATSTFSAIMGVVAFLLRKRSISRLIKLSKDRKESLLNNYVRQFKLLKFNLWLSLFGGILAIIVVYKYVPDLQIETIVNIVVIVIMAYSNVILNMMRKKFAINKLKEDLLKSN